MAKVTFSRNYDHTWPSRAVTAFKKGWSGTVRAEVEEAARAAGALVESGGGGRGDPDKPRRGRPPSKPEPAPLTIAEPAAPIASDDLRADENSQ